MTGQAVQVQIVPGSARSPSTVAAGGVELEQLGAGATTVSASITGFVALPNASLGVTISAPGITVSNTIETGSGLIRFQSGSLGASSHGGVTLTITSSDQSTLLLSPDAATVGTASIDIVMPDGTTSFSYYTHGLEGQTGNVSITASAPGFVDGSNSAAVVQPAFDIILLNTFTTVGAADDPFQVRVGIPNADQTAINYEQQVRPGGQTLNVTVDNSDAAVAQLALDGVPPAQSVRVQIAPGVARSPSTVVAGGVAFDPIAVGTTTVAATISGFIVLPNASLLVTVNP